MTIFARLFAAGIFAGSAIAAGAAQAQQWPNGPVTIVVPFVPGGTTDILGRLAAEILQNEYKANVIVENRTGAGGVIGNTSVARAAPDGQTLLLAPTALGIVPFVSKNVPYDTRRDLKPVTLMAYTYNIMVVSPQLKVKTVQDFIDLARSSPQPLNYASPGIGTPTHLGVEVFAKENGFTLRHVPYRGAAPALTDLMSGEINMMFVDLAPGIPLVEAGKIRALGILTPQRLPSLPDVPAVAETARGFYLVGWQGLLAPGGTPDAIIEKINAPIVAYLKTPAAAERLQKIGVDVKWSSPQEMREWIDSQLNYWEKTAKGAGIVPQ